MGLMMADVRAARWVERAPTWRKEVVGTVAKPSRRADGWIDGSAVRKSACVMVQLSAGGLVLRRFRTL